MPENDNQYVSLPVDVYYDLHASADNSPPPTNAQRVASTAQTLVVLSAVAAVVPVWGWGWTKAQNWLDERRYERKTRRKDKLTSVQ